MTKGRETPNRPPETVGIIGAGRLGSSLAVALNDAGYRVAGASTRRQDHALWLRKRLPGVRVSEAAQDIADIADAVFIAVDDGSIAPVCRAIRWRAGQVAVHCSGAQPISLLAPADAQGALIGGFHPLQTFPGPDEAHRFSGITFGIESPDRSTYRWLTQLAHDLGGEAIPLSEPVRASYHASAVTACGLLAGLIGLSAEMLAPLGLSRRQAVDRLMPLVASTVEAVRDRGLPAAITGPYVRGDVETVEAHVEAAFSASQNTGAAYSALALAALPLAAEQGGLTDAARAEIEQSLREAISGSHESPRQS